MIRRRLIAALCVLALLAACAPTPGDAASDETDEYAVYAAVVSDLGGGVIYERTARYSVMIGGYDLAGIAQWFAQQTPPHTLTPAMQADFRARNQARGRIESKLFLLTSTIFTEEQQASIFGGDLLQGWKQFHALYPGKQLITLSRPGFDGTHTRAVIYASYASGGTAGAGQFMLLERFGWWWMVSATFHTWQA